MKRILLAMPLCALTSCLFDPNAQRPPVHGANVPFSAKVTITDISGAVNATEVTALFESKLSAREDRQLARIANVAEVSPPGCIFETIPESRAGGELISIGKVSFGTFFDDEEDFRPLTEDEKTHIYSKTLPGGIAAGVFDFIGRNRSNELVFQERLSMPEEIKEVAANEVSFYDGVFMKKNEPLELSWRTPSTASAYSILNFLAIMEVEEASGKSRHVMDCIVQEKYFMNGDSSSLKWKIPANYISQLPVTTSGVASLWRYHVSNGSTKTHRITGRRAVVSAARLDE